MPKRKAKISPSSPHDLYQAPEEVDFSKTRFVGFGLEALERDASGKKIVELDADIANEFATSEEVNEALRLVKRIRETAKPAKRRKSA